ncbi:transposase [Clostridium septicum]|uniref:transposase n=1 Tax=Clostridium septicum TaxID=1504 RepID=UPI003216F8D4
MRGQHYTDEQKEQILQEVKEVGNVSLVGRKHGISTSTIFTWISKSKNRDQIKTKPCRKTSVEGKVMKKK